MKTLLSIALSVIVYTATGFNQMGERVLAELVDQDQNGTVSGVVYDRLAKIRVTGEWSGLGRAEVYGVDGRMYQVEVVE